MLEMVPTKFERKRTRGKHLTRNNKHYVQNEWDFRPISILMGQNVNKNKAMTKVVIAIRDRATSIWRCSVAAGLTTNWAKRISIFDLT